MSILSMLESTLSQVLLTVVDSSILSGDISNVERTVRDQTQSLSSVCGQQRERERERERSRAHTVEIGTEVRLMSFSRSGDSKTLFLLMTISTCSMVLCLRVKVTLKNSYQP